MNVELPKTGSGKIHVRERADIYHAMGNPKSEEGNRTIPIDPYVANVLREWKLRGQKGKLGLVFPTSAGNVQSLGNIRKRGLIPLMRKAAVRSADGGVRYLTKDGSKDGKLKYTGMHRCGTGTPAGSSTPRPTAASGCRR